MGGLDDGDPLLQLPCSAPPPHAFVSGAGAVPFPWLFVFKGSGSSGSDRMLGKAALQLVEHLGVGCCHLFLVLKATEGWKPVLDLSALNCCDAYFL